jgi:hypothetical protein
VKVNKRNVIGAALNFDDSLMVLQVKHGIRQRGHRGLCQERIEA